MIIKLLFNTRNHHFFAKYSSLIILSSKSIHSSSKKAIMDIPPSMSNTDKISDSFTKTKKASKDNKKIVLKTPKGTTDFLPSEMKLRTEMFAKITKIFEKHGGVRIDTPVFELKEILTGKYGEDSKLIYDLQDQGGELCSLRYDLTVPFARFLAMNQISQIKRFHIAKVYRRDQPAMTKGRRREFNQCDFDIAGLYDPMVPDAEILLILSEVLSSLGIGPFMIKLNHRCILDGIFTVAGVPNELFRSICSAVDKSDKLPWSEIRLEMIQKGVSGEVADKIGAYVQLKSLTNLPVKQSDREVDILDGNTALLDKLLMDPLLSSNPLAKQGIEDLQLLFKYLNIFQISHLVSLDLSLARGLDYYTGIIYEAILLDEPTTKDLKASKSSKHMNSEADDESVGIGSIAAGGRYDDLVGMFAGTNKKGVANKIPCVGVSIGIERIYSVLMKQQSKTQMKPSMTQVLVMSVGDGLLVERMQVTKQLWDAQISAEFMYKAKPKMQAQFNLCDKDLIPYAVILGPDELAKNQVKIKDMRNKKDGDESAGVLVDRACMVDELRARLSLL